MVSQVVVDKNEQKKSLLVYTVGIGHDVLKSA